MAKTVLDDVLDAALDEIALANIMTACDTLPTTRTEAITTYMLADVAMTPGDGNDFNHADGDTNGRKTTVSEKLAVTVDTTGTAINVALCDGTRLLYVTECTSQLLTATNTVDFPAWDIEIADPT